MERQKTTTDIKHNDDFSEALIESYGRWMDGGGFGWHLHEKEEVVEAIPAPVKKELATPERAGGADASTSIPDLSGKEEKSDEGGKDIKAAAGAPDPAANLRTGQCMKYSIGAEIKDITKVVAKESWDSCPKCGGKGCSKCQEEDTNDVKKESYTFELNGVEYVFEAEKKKLDPVGKASADIDNDGDVDKSDKYLHARRKKITKIIGTKKKMKEETEKK